MEIIRKSKLIFVSNLPLNITEKKLLTFFEQKGPIKRITIIFNREKKPIGCSIIEYINSNDAEEALKLHESFFEQRYIDVEKYKIKP